MTFKQEFVIVFCPKTGQEETGRVDLQTGQVFCGYCGQTTHEIVDQEETVGQLYDRLPANTWVEAYPGIRFKKVVSNE